MFKLAALAGSFLGLFALHSAETPSPQVQIQGYEQDMVRARTRIGYPIMTPQPWTAVKGHVSIEYGLPPWKAEYAKQFESMPPKQRWRFGADFWTNLDTTIPIRFGDVDIEPGYYYLGLQRIDGGWTLLVLDPFDTAEAGLDAWHLPQREVSELEQIALKSEMDKENLADKLSIHLRLDKKNDRTGVLEIRFGPYFLTSDFEVTLPE